MIKEGIEKKLVKFKQKIHSIKSYSLDNFHL